MFLTGHTGFKGSWLSLWLQRLGANVTGYALDPPTTPNLFEQAQVQNGMGSVRADIRNADSLQAAVRAAAPQTVFHLAAQPLVREAYADPVETYDVNVMGTIRVLEALRQADAVGEVVIVTTDKCYRNDERDRGYREDEPMGGDDPYSSSKGCVELLTASYRTSFFRDAGTARIATARAGNVIGGGDYAKDRLVPDLLAAAEGGRPARIRNPNAIRPWQHVLEPLHGYILLAEALHDQRESTAEGWNFGPADDDAKPVSWIADFVTEAWGDDASWVADDGEHPHEATYLKLDSTKARERLDWRPRLNLPNGLEWTIAWTRARLAGEDLRARCLADIERYSHLTACIS